MRTSARTFQRPIGGCAHQGRLDFAQFRNRWSF